MAYYEYLLSMRIQRRESCKVFHCSFRSLMNAGSLPRNIALAGLPAILSFLLFVTFLYSDNVSDVEFGKRFERKRVLATTTEEMSNVRSKARPRHAFWRSSSIHTVLSLRWNWYRARMPYLALVRYAVEAQSTRCWNAFKIALRTTRAYPAALAVPISSVLHYSLPRKHV